MDNLKNFINDFVVAQWVTFSDGKWHHLATVYNKGKFILYINGEKVKK